MSPRSPDHRAGPPSPCHLIRDLRLHNRIDLNNCTDVIILFHRFARFRQSSAIFDNHRLPDIAKFISWRKLPNITDRLFRTLNHTRGIVHKLCKRRFFITWSVLCVHFSHLITYVGLSINLDYIKMKAYKSRHEFIFSAGELTNCFRCSPHTKSALSLTSNAWMQGRT